MDFRILGPLEVSAGDGPIELGGRRQRTVLAALIFNANRVTSTDQLIDIVWGEDPPPTARRSIQAYVSRLRRSLGAHRIESVDPGYRLGVCDEELDADRFESLVLVSRSIADTDPAGALDAVREALALWRGPALADLRDEEAIGARALRYDERRMSAIEVEIDLQLAAGMHESVISQVEACLSEDPYRERLWGQLMLALYRSGRQADALKAFGRARQRLVGDLGIDPSIELRTLEEQILNQDPQAAGPVSTPVDRIDRSSIRNPYRGLAPFTEDDAGDFFGRERVVGMILGRFETGSRLVAVIGPSGCGKSSLIAAGAIPALRARSERSGVVLQVVRMEPGKHPFEALEGAIARQRGEAPDGMLERLETDPASVVHAVCGEAGQPTLLIVDQFEDLFVAVTPPVRDRFIAAVVRLAAEPRRDISVILALRADFYDRPLRNLDLAEPFVRGMVAVTPLNAEELRSAIVDPAACVGVRIDGDVVAHLLADVQSEPGALPQLQYVLTQLFEARNGDTITVSHYEQEGGMRGILARRAESAYLALSKGERVAAHQVFLRLVRVRDGGLVTRRRALLEEVTALSPVATLVLDRFATYRLIGFDRDPVTRQPTVSLVHEALIADWTRLRSWIALDRVDLQLREMLDVEARTWQQSGEDPDYLLVGTRLEQFEEWDRRTRLTLTDAERDYLTASYDRRSSERALEAARVGRERSLEARAHNRAVALAFVMSVAATIAAVLAIVALAFGRDAEQNASEAERLAAESEADRVAAVVSEARALASSLTHGAVASLATDPERSLLLAVHAVGVLHGSGQEVSERTIETLHVAVQSANVLYPADADRSVVIDGPTGRVGVYDVPLPTLIDLATSGITRPLSDDECAEFFTGVPCPRQLPTVDEGTAGAALSTEQAESGFVLGGTTVRVASPWTGEDGRAFAADLARFTSRTGIAVVATVPGLGSDDLSDRVDLVGLVEPVAGSTHRYPELVDLSRYLDRGALEVDHYAYLLDLMTTGESGTSSSAAPGLMGIPLAVSVKSLIWYPAVAFADAGYSVPATWGELVQLTHRIAADGRTPWCMAEAGTVPGGPATDFVEDLVLRGSGTRVYDRWVDGQLPFNAIPVRRAFDRYGEIMLEPGHVYGGIDQAIDLSIGDGMGLLQMDEPGCWLHHQGSYALQYLRPRATQLGQVGYFVLPFPETDGGGAVLGSVVFIGAVSDRPEVRELIRFLAGSDYGAALARTVGSGFVVANQAAVLTYAEADERRTIAPMAHRALTDGTFRIDASVAMGIEAAFREAMIGYLRSGREALPSILDRLGGGGFEPPPALE
ncbi:MAG: extracellular solute-binding protein [Acidimicrobiia bacterium]